MAHNRNALLAKGVQVLAHKAKDSLLAYFALYTILNPIFVIGDLHKYLCSIIQGLVDGTRNFRQAIAVPPQHGKTWILTKLATSWVMGRTPNLQVAITSFDQAHATEIAVDIKENFIRSRVFHLVFPEVSLSGVLDLQSRFSLNNGSTLRAKGAGSKLTGRRVDWLVIDDPHKGREQAESRGEREKVKRWYFGDLLSRLAPNAKIIIIATRWHPEDLIGHLTSEEYTTQLRTEGHEDQLYQFTKMEAVCSNQEEDPLGRREGAPLSPEIGRDINFLMRAKAEQTLYEWESQYQQNPQTSGSGQVDVNLIKYVPVEDFPTDLEYVRGWDLALSKTAAADYAVGILAAYDPETKTIYIADIIRVKVGWPKLKQMIVASALVDKDRWGLARIGVEGVSGFEACYEEVRVALRGEVLVEKRNPPNNDGKFIRAIRWFTVVEAGGFILARATWNRDFVEELKTFPDGSHDDQVDGISICYEMHTKRQRLLLG